MCQPSLPDLEAGAISLAPGKVVSFEKVSYSVPSQQSNKILIQDVSGMFEPGKLTAVIGPSGSGKSTLLDLLAGRKNTGTVEGQILYDGSFMGPELLSESVAYVEQFDRLLSELTVREMLTYSATLRLHTLTQKQVNEKVDEVIKSLHLEICQHTCIGDSMNRGISGGQSKRVNIGLALLSSPAVIFLDEPTSGLDSNTADQVIEILRSLADEGRTVVATIHSPSAYAFSLFDELLMLKAGRVIFEGSLTDEAAEAKNFFEAQGFSYLGSDGKKAITSHDDSDSSNRRGDSKGRAWTVSVVEWLVRVMDGPVTTDESVSPLDRASFADYYAASALHSRNQANRQAELAAVGSKAEGQKVVQTTGWCDSLQHFAHSTRTLLRFRGFKHLTSPGFLSPRMVLPVVYALVMWSLYSGIGLQAATDEQAAVSVTGLLFESLILCGYCAVVFCPSIVLDRPIFYRERADGYYGSNAYMLSKLLEDGLTQLVTTLLYALILFYGCALQGSFWVVWAVYFFTSMVGIALAYWSAAVSPDISFASALYIAMVTICMFFMGFLITQDKIPSGWRWFSKVSFYHYGWAALMKNQFGSHPDTITAPAAVKQLQLYGLDDSLFNNMAFGVGILPAFTCIILLATAVGLRVVNHENR